MRFKPRFFLLYNDLSVSSVGRTIVLRSTGCKSVFYEHSSNSLIEGVEPDLAYLLFDAVATWGQAMTGYFQRPPGNFGECWEVGCIWAEHVRVVREDEGLLKEYKTQIEHQVGRPLPEQARTISIFDTTINPVLFTQEDLSLFLADVAWLAETFPDVLIFYKTKWSIEFLTEQFGEEFQKRFQRLYEIPNVIVIPNYFETAAIIGLADLTISACFSTTAIESIGCGTRALYYDVSDRCPPDNIWGAFWHRIPELVCRSREELKDRIYKLMYETSDEEYRDYLHLNFKHMDGFFDGRAITRLRRKLADGMDARLAAEQDYGR
ncbi:MAG: hypothetical protein O2954_20005 [bacterium]|nr:hypothetical protein [bacterium]